MSKSRGVTRRQLIVGAAPIAASVPFAGLALGGRKDLEATHLGGHGIAGHAAMISTR